MAERGSGPPVARLFIALWPDDATRCALAAWRDRWRWPRGAAVIADERLHMTLHFIGAVPAARVGAVAAGLEVPFEPFTLDGATAERWRGGLATGCFSAPPQLRELHARLADALRRLALPVEQRPFRAHVTLARRAAGATAPAEPAAALVWPVRDYALVQSQDGYRVLQRYA